MPVTLAMAATDRSISAQRMTKVRPTAMMPVTETWVRILAALSSEANEWLAALKKTSRTIKVTKGAMLRIWLRTKTPTIVVISRGLQQAVLAHHPVSEFLHDASLLHHQD